MYRQQLKVPDKLKVGFHKREDTYSGLLAYVIYFDHKGVLRKERSWEGWRDKKIKPQEHDNKPTSGFVLNRDVGGVAHSYHDWNPRLEKVRVWDPRGWEFEITIPNLLNILKDCACSPGKGLEGEFVYSWDKDRLILLPVNSTEYKMATEYAELQKESVKSAELTVGASYQFKDEQVWTYLGKFQYHFMGIIEEGKKPSTDVKRGWCWKHVFTQEQEVYAREMGYKKVKANVYKRYSGLDQVAKLHSEEINPRLPELIEEYNLLPHGKQVNSIAPTKPIGRDRRYNYSGYVQTSKNVIELYSWQRGSTNYDYRTGKNIVIPDGFLHIARIELKDGVLTKTQLEHTYVVGKEAESIRMQDWYDELRVTLDDGTIVTTGYRYGNGTDPSFNLDKSTYKEDQYEWIQYKKKQAKKEEAVAHG